MADQDTTTGGTGTEGLDDASRPSAAPVHQPSIADDVGLVYPTNDVRISNLSADASDVARLLDDVKLPERSEFRGAADRALVSPEPVLQAETPPQSPPEPKAREIVSAVHTLKDDFQSAVNDQKISLVQAAALQEEKRTRLTSDPTSSRIVQQKKSVRIITTILAFTILGVIVLGASFFLIQDRANITPATFLVNGLLFSEQTIPLSLQRAEGASIKRQLGDFRASGGLTLGAITRIAPTVDDVSPDGTIVTREATTKEFLEALETSVPDELLRALGSEFFFGFHTVDENAPLLVIPVSSYERAFAGMLLWEKTLNADLTPIFTGVPSLVRQPDGLLVERAFTDSVMRNFDIRTLKDDAGTTQLYYSFPTRTILIIAESPYSFAEVLARLRADRKL